ncbi:MAG TPA: DUF3047 domain-containing protein [Noviherbaspirillum sp.]|uniref:DUF3047 domain-containing protein n=1 Tax=Noviherbaspirillum sp. TaxID=1926288 RepID=UPI002D3C46B4|nr:DUF3047 domain-containing protein [Noviherbaspirillum sp.]HYD96574.1 DUF3047 domain-containing protein [Noviherbaspirillum sp.]
MMTGYLRAAAIFTGLTTTIIASAGPEVPRFSAMPPGGPVLGWEALKPAPKANDTQYTLVREGGHTVLKAQAESAMSGLLHVIRVDVQRYPLLRWRWKIAAPLQTSDMRTRAGDDYAARIYVVFDYPFDRLPFGTRAGIRLAESVYGQKIPTAALNYVWDNRQPVGTLQPNTYTDRARMIVVRSGGERAGQWLTETRDLAADFRAAFGEEPPAVVAVALATDTDNTGERATAWYGDIEFLPREAAPR